jgi:hypothetical protein
MRRTQGEGDGREERREGVVKKQCSDYRIFPFIRLNGT